MQTSGPCPKCDRDSAVSVSLRSVIKESLHGTRGVFLGRLIARSWRRLVSAVRALLKMTASSVAASRLSYSLLSFCLVCVARALSGSWEAGGGGGGGPGLFVRMAVAQK